MSLSWTGGVCAPKNVAMALRQRFVRRPDFEVLLQRTVDGGNWQLLIASVDEMCYWHLNLGVGAVKAAEDWRWLRDSQWGGALSKDTVWPSYCAFILKILNPVLIKCLGRSSPPCTQPYSTLELVTTEVNSTSYLPSFQWHHSPVTQLPCNNLKCNDLTCKGCKMD